MGGIGAGAATTLIVVVGLAFLVMGVGLPVAVVLRAKRAAGALRHGLAAEGRVLDTYVTHHHEHASTRHAIIGFRAADGREYRIDDENGRQRVVGDFVQLRYLPDRPDQAVPANTSVAALAGASVFICIVGGVFAVVGAVVLTLGLTGVLVTDSMPDPTFP